MSGIRPFEGSGEPLLTTINTPSTTTKFYDNDSATKISTLRTIGNDVTVGFTTTSAQSQSNSAPYPFLLPFWGWAAVLVGTTLLLSVTLICVLLCVGRRKSRRRRNYQVNCRPRRSQPQRCNSTLWIDLEQVDSIENTPCTNHGTTCTLEMRKASRNNGKSTCNYSGSNRHSSHRVKGKETEMKNSLFFSEEDLVNIRKERERSEQLQSEDQEKCKPKDTCLRLNDSFLHLQAPTTTTFKLETVKENHSDSHSLIKERLSDKPVASDSSGGTPESERKVDLGDEDEPPISAHDDRREQDLWVRSSEASASEERYSYGEQSETSLLPRSIYFNDNITGADVTITTFTQFAFNTL